MVVTSFRRRPFANAITTVCLILAKCLRIYAQKDALPLLELAFWWPFLFAQDTLVLLGLHALSRENTIVLGEGLAAVVFLTTSIFAAFFFTTGTELQWRNFVRVAGDLSSWKMCLSGSMTLLMASAAIFVVALLLQPVCYFYTEVGYSMVTKLLERVRPRTRRNKETIAWNTDGPLSNNVSTCNYSRQVIRIFQAWQYACTILQSSTSINSNLSLTLPVLAFEQVVTIKTAYYAHSTYGTALTPPVPYPWLPKTSQAGFTDWYSLQDHYNAAYDFLNGSRIDAELLPALQQVDLKGISIKNVLLLSLESTRKDAFPIEANSSIWERLASTFDQNRMPPHVAEKITSLTPFANYITGKSEDDRWPVRGIINAKNAFTTSTYTLKSLTGTHCGVTPLAADFNVEATHHVYQPCLAHILNVFNQLDASQPWTSKFMQSTTMLFDQQDSLMTKLGFQEVIGVEQLETENATKLAPVNMADVNYFGMPEVALEAHLRDALSTARETNQRLFLSHLTSTTHHPFAVPETTGTFDFSGSTAGRTISDYLNSMGYVDSWLGKVMDIMQEEGSLNETLIIAVGDHGLSLVEDGRITPYQTPHLATLRVPLVISLPGLPMVDIDIDHHVSAVQILPTILDLLIETDSLSDQQRQAARDLLHNSEGQSLLRVPGHGHWQFVVTNPGGITVSVRDERRPNWLLAVPIIEGEPWRFVDLQRDPFELKPIRALTPEALIQRVARYNVTLPGEWLEEVTNVTQWWLHENHRRWRYER